MRLKYLRIQSDISDHICAIPSCKELNMQIITNQFQKELKKHGSDHFPFLVSYQCLSEYDSNSFMWHCHPEIEITYVKEGSIYYLLQFQCPPFRRNGKSGGLFLHTDHL